MATDEFFRESSEQSKVKSAIVSKYFWSWAKVVTGSGKSDRIAYLDLFAGPGRYVDGTISTPLLILEKTIADPVLRNRLVCIFNDKDTDNTRELEKAIDTLPGIELLKFKPEVMNNEVGEKMVKAFEKIPFVPTLFFVDPWGYEGLSLRLVDAILKDWACECVFFFNFNRINMGLSNDIVAGHMDALFGGDLARDLRTRLAAFSDPNDRELAVLETLCEALGAGTGRYVLPFTFKNDMGTRTKHHLIFVSKHKLGYGIMKEIMAGESSNAPQGVSSFAYSPADKRFPVLFEFSRPLDELQDVLLYAYAGKRLSVQDIFEKHNIGTRYVMKNYKRAIINLEENGHVTTNRSIRNRQRRECPERVIVTFA